MIRLHHYSRPVQKQRRGFTIPEVLATLALLGIALPVVMRGISLATRAGGYARRQGDAGALAESKLNELVATNQVQTDTSLSGDFGPDWPQYQWTAAVKDWTGGGNQGGMKQVQLHVISKGDPDLIVTTLFYNGSNASPTNSNSSSTGSGSGSGGSAGSGSAKTGSGK